VRARVFAAALAFSVSLIGRAAAQDPPPEVDAPQLPPEAPKASSVTAIPLPAKPPPQRPPLVEKRASPPPIVQKPKAVAEKPKGPSAAVEKASPESVPASAPKPSAECVIKPVMSDDDLRACGAGR